MDQNAANAFGVHFAGLVLNLAVKRADETRTEDGRDDIVADSWDLACKTFEALGVAYPGSDEED